MDSQLSPLIVDTWRERLQSTRSDVKRWAYWQTRMVERAQLRPEILGNLASFLEGRMTLDDFRRVFDSKSRSQWGCYGLAGMSGSMWLNKLVKHMPDQAAIAEQLKAAFRAPTDEAAARRQGLALEAWLATEIREGRTTRGAIQPGRANLLLSAYWHMQTPENWPIAYQSLREMLQGDRLVDLRADGIELYLQLRSAVRSLCTALGVTATDLEFVPWQIMESKVVVIDPPTPPPVIVPVPGPFPDVVDPPDAPSTDHAEAQFLLATIAKDLGLRVWIARNDRNKTWKGKPLGEISLQEAPAFGIDPQTQRMIELIDVLWIKNKTQVVAAFEIESTTSIYSGLLRMSDLAATAPNISFPVYVVVPEGRMSDVRKQLRRPTFQTLELHRRCGFFSIEDLRAQAVNIVRFGGGPEAIEGLAQRVGDVADEEVLP